MNDKLKNILEELTNDLTHPDRPFTGQPHTDAGERGKTEVKGIRFRDLADCVVKAFIDSAVFTIKEDEREELRRRAEDGTLNYNDVYRLDLSKMDPLALQQNVCIRVEKAMGIFPNIPKIVDKGD